MTADWTDMAAAERIALDREFAGRVEASSFSRQEWGLVMSALEFEIETPEDPANAQLRPDTSKVPAILPALDEVETAGVFGGRGDTASESSVVRRSGGRAASGGDGIDGVIADARGRTASFLEWLADVVERRAGDTIEAVVRSLGLQTGADRARMAEIDALASQYCELLQRELQANGRWHDVCRLARA